MSWRRHVLAEAIEPRLLLSTYTVNTSLDPVLPIPGLLTLREAVGEANDNPGADTIAFDPTVFLPGTLHTITLTQGQIEFTDTTGITTVSGPGTAALAISGGSASRVFEIDSGAIVAISGLQIIDGKQTTADASGNAYGGGIYNAGTLTVTNSVISGNQVVGSGTYTYDTQATAGRTYGGGIYSTGSLTITGSTLSNNTVTNLATKFQTSSAISNSGTAAGGAIFSADIALLALSNDTITDNSLSASNEFNGVTYVQYANGGFAAGGGVYAAGAMTVSDCSVTGNTTTAGDASSYGSGNGGNAYGGGIFVSGLLTMTSSVVENNNLNSGRSSFDGGFSGAAHGGGVDAEAGASISTTTISSNNMTAGDAGFSDGVSAGGGLYAPFGATLNSDTINENNILGGPGAPADDVQGSNITTSGGGIFGGDLNINNSSITGNTITSRLQVKSGAVVGGHNVGGGITSAGMSSITNSTVSGNSVIGGHGLYAYSNYQTTYGGNADGGGIYNSGPLTITNSTIAANHATGGAGADADSSANLPGQAGGNANGGAIFTSQNLTVYDSTITGNTATGGKGGAAYYYHNQVYQPAGPAGTPTGGGIDIAAGLTLLDNSIVSANTTIGENDIHGNASPASASNLIGVGGGLTNGINGNKVGINNPDLSPLANNGGPTLTMIPLSGSPVIDAGINSLIPSGVTTDQRGAARIVGKAVDIGATEFQTAISGTVFNDANANGVQDTGELGIPGVTVFIDTTNAGVFKTGDPQTVTNSSGFFSFTGLSSGTYIVRQILPTGEKQISPTNGFGNHATLTTGQVDTSANFADENILLGSISGSVLSDAGYFGSPTGPGIAGVTVFIDLTNAGVLKAGDPQTVTDSSGNYSFTGLAAGTYIVRQIVRSSDIAAYPLGGLGNHVSLTIDEAVTGVDFGDIVGQGPTGVIAGTVFNDLNGNGVQDTGELGLGGVTVYLDLNNAGVFQAGDPQTTTDATGVYAFTVFYGSYIVRQMLPAGDTQVFPTSGFGQHETIGPPTSFSITNANFGDLIPPPTAASISGTAYYDVNGNGIRNISEQGIPGVNVYIDLNNAGVFQSGDPQTTTDSSGNYSFTGLAAGTYIVRQMLPVGDQQTSPAGGLGNHVTVTAGQQATNFNFGEQKIPGPLSSITGTVYAGSIFGNQTVSGNVGVAGVTVFIDANHNGQFDSGEISTTTDAAGVYTFTGLAPGNYDIDAVPPQGSVGLSGLSEAIDGSANYLTLGTNQAVTNINFRELFQVFGQTPAPVEFSGIVRNANGNGMPNVTVYVDLNNNGKLDPGEPATTTGLAGSFSFELFAGSFIVRQIVPAGDTQTSPGSGAGDRIIILPGQEFLFGNAAAFTDQGPITTNSISGSVFNDLNNDGSQDDAEPGISGVVMYIDLDNAGVFQAGDPEVTTDALGNYTFIGLTAGTYIVRQMVPKGFTQTSPTNNFGNHVLVSPNQGSNLADFADEA
jgi:uncharacterized protein (DUF2141 family)